MRCALKTQRGLAEAVLLYVIAGLGVALLLSGAANAWLFHERDKAIEARGVAAQLNADTRAAAHTCSTSVDRLALAGAARDGRIEAALKQVAPQVKADQAAALRALQARPDNPADLCGSALRFLQRSIKEERVGK